MIATPVHLERRVDVRELRCGQTFSIINVMVQGRSLVLLAWLSGCASVPRQSVELASALSNQTADMRRVSVELTNRYFDEVERRMREALMGKYKDAIVEGVRTKLKEKGRDLTIEQYDKIVMRVLTKQSEVIASVETTRSQALSEILNRYTLLETEIRSLQNLLASAAGNQDVLSKLLGSIPQQVPTDVLRSVDETVNRELGALESVQDAASKSVGQ